MNEERPVRLVALDVYLDHHDMGGSKPSTPMEALMNAAPFMDPEESSQELQPFREAVADCLDLLEEHDRYVIDALNSERVTLQVLGDRLGVSRMHASRLRDSAMGRLRGIMLEHPVIRERLNLGENID